MYISKLNPTCLTENTLSIICLAKFIHTSIYINSIGLASWIQYQSFHYVYNYRMSKYYFMEDTDCNKFELKYLEVPGPSLLYD